MSEPRPPIDATRSPLATAQPAEPVEPADVGAARTDLEQAAARVRRRLALRHALHLLDRSAPWLWLTAALALIGGRLLVAWSYAGGTGGAHAARVLAWNQAMAVGWLGLVGLAVAWVLTVALYCHGRRPGPARALAIWDAAGGYHERYVSAYWFSHKDAPTAGERLHIQQARARLGADYAALPTLLPLALPTRALFAPILVAALWVGPWMEAPLRLEDQPLTAEAKQRIRAQRDRLKETADQLEKLDGLTDAEKRAAKALGDGLAETADKLADGESRTPRQVLQALEARAREAERMAAAMGAAAEMEWSNALVDELERHADTAPLATALRSGDLEAIGKEARALAERLERGDLTLEEGERLRRAFEGALKAASEADRDSPMGKALKKTLAAMNEDRSTAGQSLRALAEQMAEAAKRNRTRQRLRRLAGDIRSQGQRMLGQGRDGLKRLSKERLRKRRDGRASARRRMQRQLDLAHLLQRNPAGANGTRRQERQYRLSKEPWGQGGHGAPIPGQGFGAGMGRAPMPGQGFGPGMGRIPIPGAGRTGKGGLEAGRGTAPYNENRTDPHAASDTRVVAPVPGGPGPSEVRAVINEGHRESAAVGSTQAAATFLKEQTEALEDDALPLTRRDQVRRYLRAIRETLEKE